MYKGRASAINSKNKHSALTATLAPLQNNSEPILKLKDLIPINILELDRADRSNEFLHINRMLEAGVALKHDTVKLVAAADSRTQHWTRIQALQDGFLEEIIQEEIAITDKAILRTEAYVSEFKVHAANIMLDKLLHVYRFKTQY